MKYLTLNAPWNAFFDQKPTFYWVLHEYQKEICEPPNKRAWKAASTLAHYSRLYNELILPRVNPCALADFSLLEFEDIVIKALPDGNVLRLGDVADIELGRLAYTFNNMVNGHKAVSCIVYQMAGSYTFITKSSSGNTTFAP